MGFSTCGGLFIYFFGIGLGFVFFCCSCVRWLVARSRFLFVSIC